MDQLQPWHCPLDEVGKYFNFRNFVSLTKAKDKIEEENKCKGKKIVKENCRENMFGYLCLMHCLDG